jgi:hypothetical protein
MLGKFIGKIVTEVVVAPIEIIEEVADGVGRAVDPPPKKPRKTA